MLAPVSSRNGTVTTGTGNGERSRCIWRVSEAWGHSFPLQGADTPKLPLVDSANLPTVPTLPT